MIQGTRDAGAAALEAARGLIISTTLAASIKYHLRKTSRQPLFSIEDSHLLFLLPLFLFRHMFRATMFRSPAYFAHWHLSRLVTSQCRTNKTRGMKGLARNGRTRSRTFHFWNVASTTRRLSASTGR